MMTPQERTARRATIAQHCRQLVLTQTAVP